MFNLLLFIAHVKRCTCWARVSILLIYLLTYIRNSCCVASLHRRGVPDRQVQAGENGQESQSTSHGAVQQTSAAHTWILPRSSITPARSYLSVKATFHDTDILADILARILADSLDTRDPR